MKAGLLPFLQLARRLKEVPRRGWALKLGHPQPESVAEHSYMVALLAALMAMERGLDAGEASLMGLLHDLHEAITGDKVPGEARAPGEELRAAERLFSLLPPGLRQRLQRLWLSYYREEGELARLVGEADALEMALQAQAYEEEGYGRGALREFLESASSS